LVKRNRLPVRWDSQAVDSLRDIYEYIKEDSTSAAHKVRKALLSLAKSLGTFPEKYARERNLINEPENYRSASKWSYKLIYEVTETEVIIVMVFHTSQHPGKIKRKIK